MTVAIKVASHGHMAAIRDVRGHRASEDEPTLSPQDHRKGKEILLSITKSAGRAALAAMFVHGGSAAAREPGKRVKLLEDAGVPHPELAVRANGAVMAVAGGMLALGIAPRTAAAVLAGSLVPTTIVGHPFWKEEAGARAAQEIQFMKNLAMLGGLLLVMAEE